MNRSMTFRRLASVVTLLFVVLLFGTRSVAQSAPSISGFRLPFEGGPFSIVQGPSCPQYSHLAVLEAIDFVMPEGTHLIAVQSGTVVFVGWDGNYGNQVRVTHDNGLTSWYNHIQPNGFQVSVGDRVNQGQLLALSGTTGYSSGPHLHFEMREGGTQVAIDTLPGISWNAESGGRCTGSATGTPVTSSNGNFALLSLQVGHLEIFRRDPSSAANHRWWDGGASWVGSWDPLGITISGTPSIVSWGTDRQDFFVHAADGAIYRQTWTRGGVRGPWIHMPGLTTNDDLTAFSLQPNSLEVLANGGGILYHNWSDDAGVTWSGWQSLGIRNRGVPTVITSGPDRQDIFVHGEDNVIYHQTWTRTGGRTNWTSMNGTTYDDIAVISPQPGHLVAFVRGTDGFLYHSWSTDTGTTWSPWQNLGHTLLGKPAVVSWAPDRTDVVVRGDDDVMYHLAYTSSGWGNWESLGGQTKFAPQAISWGNGRLDVFHIGLDGNFYHKWWTGSLQSAWYQVGTYQYVPPQIILSPLQLTRGAQQNESGSGFTPNGPLHMSIRLPDGTYYEQALQADANGSFATPYTMPMNAQIGHYAYRIQDLTTGVWSNTVEYDVLASTPPVTPTTVTATATATAIPPTPTATATRTATALTATPLTVTPPTVTMTPTATATRTATTATAIPPTATTLTPTPTAATLTPTPTASAATGSVLALVPAATTLSVGGTLAVAVEVRSGTQPIDGAAVYLDFDPAVLEVVSIIPSASLPISLTQKSDPIGGHLDLIRGAISSLPQGTFSLATVTFRARTAAPTGTLLSMSRTTARPSDVSFGGVSKLGQTIPATLTIRDGSVITVDVPFEGRPQAPSVRLSVPLSVTLTLAGASTPAYQATLTTDQYGRFPLVGIVPGTYTLSVKHPQSLRVQITAVITSGTATLSLGLLPSGDANNDNQINLLDFSLLSGTFGKSSSSTGYDSRADFNNDSMINLLDFSLLVKNFGKAGLASSSLALTTVNTPQVVAQVVRDLRAGETFALDLAVNAPMTGIDGAAAYLNFDPMLLEVATITGDPTLDLSLQQEIDNPNGQVALVRGTLTSPFPTGRVNLGRITFRVRTPASAAVITLVDDGALRQSAVTANGRTLSQTDAPWQLTATTAGYSVYLPLVVR